jgi:membrane protease YdiL (CAAX protease family)
MTDRAELLTISALALSLPMAGVVRALTQHTRVAEYSAARTIAMLAFELAVIAIGAFILRRRGWSARPFRVRITPLAILIGVMLTILYVWTSWIVFSVTMRFVPEVRLIVRHTAPVWLTITFFVVNSFFEEAFASAYLVEAFERAKVVHVVTWSAAIRAAYHLYQGPSGTICVFLLGAALAQIYRRERHIGIPFTAHTIINVAIYYFGRSG